MTSIRCAVKFLCAMAIVSAAGQTRGREGTAAVDDFLESLHGDMQARVSRYADTRLDSVREFEDGGLKDDSSEWSCVVTGSPAGEADSLDVTARFRLEKGTAPSSAVSVAFGFGRWSTENYVLVPAAVYNGNRYRAIGNAYNPEYPLDMFYNPELPLTMSDNPRLALAKGEPSRIELQTGSASTPAVCFYSPELQRAFILLTDQGTRLGNSGIVIEENEDRTRASIEIGAPAVRTLAAGFGGFFPSGDRAADWKAGDELCLRFRLFAFPAHSIPDLLTRFMTERKSLSGPNHPRKLVPMSKHLDLAAGICSDNWQQVPAGGFYRPENSPHFQLCWVSGMMNTYPMLALDDEKERARVREELNFVVDKLQGESGYFYGGITAEGKIRPENKNPAVTPIHAMVRKNSDALLWMIKHFLLLREQGHGDLIEPRWEESARRLARAFVATWKQHGQFGQYIEPQTGRIAVFNSTGGAVAPAGLALASRYFGEEEFLAVAVAAARYYYERDVAAQGLTGGHCGDISQDADSESAMGFLESLMTLYSCTGDREWLDKAKVAAALGSTWILSYDVRFPPESQIAKLQSPMAGAVWASVQNKHAAPGICLSSGDCLFKLYRATGDRRYADLIRDIQHAHTEAVDMPGHRTTNYGFGTSMERIQPSDAEGRGSVGNYVHTRNSWTETDGMLMDLELPGVYLLTDKDESYVFDHVEANVVSRQGGKVTLSIGNRTPYDARVSVFAESSEQARRPLSPVAFVAWPRFEVKSCETRTITLPPEPRAD